MEYLRTFKEIDREDLDFAGGKGANLGEMVKIGLPVPPGFVIGTNAYFDFLTETGLRSEIEKLLTSDLENPEKLLEVAGKITRKFQQAKIPGIISQEIVKYYQKLGNGKVAVRSSSTVGDSPQVSFAGLHETFLNVSGKKELLASVKDCWASFFKARAIFFRIQSNFSHFKIGFAVVVQKMVESQVSGIMFTEDPVTNDKQTIVIEAIYGLGELVAFGEVTPDQYRIRKSDGKILEKKIFPQNLQLVAIGGKNRKIPVSAKFANIQKLSDSGILELANYGKQIENHYYFSQDIEWAQLQDKIYILQTRPVTTLSGGGKVGESEKEKLKLSTLNLQTILEGTPASPGIVSGPVKILEKASGIRKISKGDILVTEMTNPDFVPAMKKSAAVVTDRGGRTSHAAIVSRELGIPAIVGTGSATKILKNRQIVTVDGSKGKVFAGSPKINGKTLTYIKKPVPAPVHLRTVTKIYVNLASSEIAEEVSRLDVDGVGLLRAEFMIAEIGIHPKQIILSRKSEYFIKKLYDGLVHFAKCFTPRPVIYRATDFKTNEYRHLKGGAAFEPKEENPMLGLRGALRFLTQPEVFAMELEAIKRVYAAGFDNLKLMIPFVRTLEELAKVRNLVENYGLTKLVNFELWMMIEVPSNVILLEDFLKMGLNGVSIGSNDLTMLILGADRDNEQLAGIFNEMDPAILAVLERLIRTCRRFGVPCSICGQAPSVFDQLIQKLVWWGISSISVSPDSVDRVRQLVHQTELEMVTGKITQPKTLTA